MTLQRASEDFYGRKRRQYAVEYQQQRQREKEKNEGKPIPRNMPRETVADYGKPFVRRVIENYHQDRISLSEASGYLGVKVRHVSGIERQLGF
jgi:ribosome-binding protein aMBF1 (putative translation factor)